MIDKLREFLANLNLQINEQVFSPTENVYLAKLTDFNTNFSSFGKGESKEEALLSAYGEMCERLITKNYFEEYYINDLYPDMLNCDFLNEELECRADIYPPNIRLARVVFSHQNASISKKELDI